MQMNKITRTPVGADHEHSQMNPDTRRCRFIAHIADLSALIRVNLTTSPSTSVGARVAGMGLGGPSWSPVGGDGIMFLQEVSRGYRTRATIKAHPTALHPPSPLGGNHLHFDRLMRITADLSALRQMV